MKCAGKQKTKPRERCACGSNSNPKRCKRCRGSELCKPHNVNKYSCTRCNGPRSRPRCPCGSGQSKIYCRICHGPGLCEHDRRRFKCRICRPDGFFKEKIRKITARAFKSNGVKKNQTTTSVLGCTLSEYRDFIDAQIETWNATFACKMDRAAPEGSEEHVDVDHIKPFKTVAYQDTEGIRAVAHFTNHQPLPSFINQVLKRDSWCVESDERWKRDVYLNNARRTHFWPTCCAELHLPPKGFEDLWLLASLAAKRNKLPTRPDPLSRTTNG